MVASLIALPVLMIVWPTAPPDVHTQLQQRLLEAELGSARTFHLAAGSRSTIPSDTTLSTLISNLRSALPDIRWAAAKELAVRRNPHAVEAIINAMQDPEGTLRVCVMASALGRLKDPRALSALTAAAFDTGNRDLRLCAIQSLGMIGDRKAVPTLIEALQQGNMPVAAANALARLGDERGVQPIIQAASNPDLRLWMVMALGELGNSNSLDYLHSLRQQKSLSVRNAATEATWKIQQLSSAQPVNALSLILADERNESRRMWAAFRLGERQQVASVFALVKALQDSSEEVRSRSGAALIRIGKAAAPALRITAKSNLVPARLYAIAALGYVGTSQDLGLLQRIRHDSDNDVLTTAAQRSVELINRFSTSRNSLSARKFPAGKHPSRFRKPLAAATWMYAQPSHRRPFSGA